MEEQLQEKEKQAGNATGKAAGSGKNRARRGRKWERTRWSGVEGWWMLAP